MYNAMNFSLKYSDATNTTVSYLQIKYLLCPSEPNTTPVRSDASPSASRITAGRWATGTSSAAAVRSPTGAPSASTSAATLAAFTDGLSNTLLAAEVKANQPLYKSCCDPAAASAPTSYPDRQCPPSPAFVAANYTNGCKADAGHVKWSIGSACYDGFTTALPPNYR